MHLSYVGFKTAVQSDCSNFKSKYMISMAASVKGSFYE